MNINTFFYCCVCILLKIFLRYYFLSEKNSNSSLSLYPSPRQLWIQAVNQEGVCHKQCFSSICNKGFVLLVSAPVSFSKIKWVCRCESIPRASVLLCSVRHHIGSLCSNHTTLSLDRKPEHQEILVFLIYFFFNRLLSHSEPFSCGFY